MTLDEWVEEKRKIGWTWADIACALYDKSGEISREKEEEDE